MQLPLATQDHVLNQEYLVILPDRPNSLPTRLAQHAPHFEAAKPDVASGFFKVAGKIYEEPFVENQPHKIAGTFLIVRAPRREDVEKRLKEDLFYQHGVWNWDELQIYPCKSTFSPGAQAQTGGKNGL